jgi:hypothetical protein
MKARIKYRKAPLPRTPEYLLMVLGMINSQLSLPSSLPPNIVVNLQYMKRRVMAELSRIAAK